MINQQDVLDGIKAPIQRYNRKMTNDFSDWQSLEDAAARLLREEPLNEEDFSPPFRPMLKMMRMIMEKSKDNSWRWTDPEVLAVFREVATGDVYKLFAETIVDIVTGIISCADIGTLVEVGAGTGQVSGDLCRAMRENGVTDIPLIISDQSPMIHQTGERLREAYPEIKITDIVWDLKKGPNEFFNKDIHQPVMMFERFCMPYAGYDAIDVIGQVADILILVDDLSVTGEKASFDRIYERIGTQFLIFDEAQKHLEKHFSFIHACDREIIEMVNSPVISFTLAIK